MIALAADPTLAGALVIPHGVVMAGAIGLGAIALLLAWPVPVALSRTSWPTRTPVIALLVWHAIVLIGGLSMIAALALAGFSFLPDQPWFALIPAALFLIYLVSHLAVTVVQVTRLRHRHLAL